MRSSLRASFDAGRSARFSGVSSCAMHDHQPGEILLTAAQIQSRVVEMAAEIRRDVPDDLHLVAVLKGAFMFLADLARRLDGEVSLDFLVVSSYAKGTSSSGEIR